MVEGFGICGFLGQPLTLTQSRKNRSENVRLVSKDVAYLVDFLRNDLGVLCRQVFCVESLAKLVSQFTKGSSGFPRKVAKDIFPVDGVLQFLEVEIRQKTVTLCFKSSFLDGSFFIGNPLGIFLGDGLLLGLYAAILPDIVTKLLFLKLVLLLQCSFIGLVVCSQKSLVVRCLFCSICRVDGTWVKGFLLIGRISLKSFLCGINLLLLQVLIVAPYLFFLLLEVELQLGQSLGCSILQGVDGSLCSRKLHILCCTLTLDTLLLHECEVFPLLLLGLCLTLCG